MKQNATGPVLRPLHAWELAVPLRRYQEEFLRTQEPADGRRLHLVAPLGAGKTLVGLALAARNGRRALVLAPTKVIREQWAAQARDCFRHATLEPQVADGVADLTVQTYQALSVVDGSERWQEAAALRWADELVRAGRTRPQAEEWLKSLLESNPAAYRSGLSTRASAIRRNLAATSDEVLAATLHPAARERLDALVTAGVQTLVLDECHHLRAHWAAVVHYLARCIQAQGGRPTLIGLTATLPDHTDSSWDRYHALLGDVDAEIPLPAVIAEGQLSPYSSLAWFVLPSPAEQDFMRHASEELRHRVEELLLSADGVDWLVDLVAPPMPPEPGDGADGEADGAEAGGAEVSEAKELPDDATLVSRIAAGFDAAPNLAPAATALLRQTGSYRQTPRSVDVVPLLPETHLLEAAEPLALLGRYALDRLLPDPRRRAEWRAVKELLAGYGHQLTDSGLNRSRAPMDTITAASRSKDVGVVEILRLELDALGEQMRAVVVTEAAERSATHRAVEQVFGTGEGKTVAGGARRCFQTLLTDAVIRRLHPVLLTSNRLHLASGELLLEELRAATSLPLTPVNDDGVLLDVRGGGVGSAALVRAVSEMMAAGRVRLVVGTRGLLGEGWDCPAVNTLIDLTTVTTSTSVAQLRGRTLRLDPRWPGKAAHNWDVVCLPPVGAGAHTHYDLDRLERRSTHQWGVTCEAVGAASPAGSSAVEVASLAEGQAATIATGIDTLLAARQQELLAQSRTQGGSTKEEVRELNQITGQRVGDRSVEHVLWQAACLPALEPAEASGAMAVRRGEQEALLLTSRGRWLRRGPSEAFWAGAARAVLSALVSDGAVSSGAVVESLPGQAGAPGSESVTLVVRTRPWEAAQVLDTLSALLSTPARSPRFVLEVSPFTFAHQRGGVGPVGRVLGGLLDWRLRRGRVKGVFLGLPTALGRSGAVAAAFVQAWRQEVGPCRLHLVRDRADSRAFLAACGAQGAAARVSVRRLRLWR